MIKKNEKHVDLHFGKGDICIIAKYYLVENSEIVILLELSNIIFTK